MKLLAILIGLMILGHFTDKTFSQEKVKYVYQDRQKVDLGDLTIKGRVLAPGDISILQGERKKFNRDLLDRKEFDYEIRSDVLNLR